MTEDPETPACAHPILSMPFRAAERVVEQAGGRIGRRVAEHAAVVEAREICAACPRLAGCEDPDYEGVIGGRLQRGKYRGPKVAPAPLVEAAPRAEVSAPVDASSLLDFDFVTGLDPALEEERPRPRRRPAGWRVDVCRRCGCLIHRRDERCPGCAARRAEKLRPRVLTSVTTGGRMGAMTTTPTSTAATATVDYVVEVYDPDSPEDVYRRELVTDMPEEHRTATGEHFARKYPACGVRLIRVTTEPLATF